MKGIVENVSIARNGQVVLRINSLDYWTNEGYLHALLSSKGLPADIFMLEGCELEFVKNSHKAGDAVLDGNGKPLASGQKYAKDGQRMQQPSIIQLGNAAKEFRTLKTKAVAKMSVKGAFSGIFSKSQRSAPADNAIIDTQKDGSTTQQHQAANASVKDVVGADPLSGDVA